MGGGDITLNKIEALITTLKSVCRVVEGLDPEVLEWAGVDNWWHKHRNEDASEEGERQVHTPTGAFEEKCKVLRRLTQAERETFGYGRFPLRLEDFDA